MRSKESLSNSFGPRKPPLPPFYNRLNIYEDNCQCIVWRMTEKSHTGMVARAKKNEWTTNSRKSNVGTSTFQVLAIVIGKIIERKCGCFVCHSKPIDIVAIVYRKYYLRTHWNGIQVSFGSSFYTHFERDTHACSMHSCADVVNAISSKTNAIQPFYCDSRDEEEKENHRSEHQMAIIPFGKC